MSDKEGACVCELSLLERPLIAPDDFIWQLSWQEEKRQAEYERLIEKFFEKYIPECCDERINQLAENGEDERHPEIEPVFGRKKVNG